MFQTCSNHLTPQMPLDLGSQRVTEVSRVREDLEVVLRRHKLMSNSFQALNEVVSPSFSAPVEFVTACWLLLVMPLEFRAFARVCISALSICPLKILKGL